MSLKARTSVSELRLLPAQRLQGTADDGDPEVLTSSRMIELMELAAARFMRTHLGDGESSVSVSMNLTHAAKVGVTGLVRAVATYEGTSGRIHRFTINAFDESGLIGSGIHTRAVVGERRLAAQARHRAGPPALLLDA